MSERMERKPHGRVSRELNILPWVWKHRRHWGRAYSMMYRDKNDLVENFPCGLVVKNLPANAGDMGSTLDLGRSHVPQSGSAHAVSRNY